MTRDEAIEIVEANWEDDRGGPEKMVDAIRALGLMEFDEPATPEDELRQGLRVLDPSFVRDVFDTMSRLNLKVVRKED